MKAYLIRHGDKAKGEYRTEGLGLNDQPLSRRLRLAPVRDPRLNEIDIGAAEGPTASRGQRPRPGSRTSSKRSGGLGGTIVVAAHEGILKILVCTILGLPVYSRFLLRIDTAGITEVEWDAGRSRWRLIKVNQSV